ncbi:hypothetical protein SMICM304S_09934 [Streptomyces microflavus]
MAEGAAIVVLERVDDARARVAVPLVLLAGTGATTDAHHPTSPHPSGAVAQAAVDAALADAGWRAEDVDHVNAHGTSTPLNDATEAALIGRAYPHRPPVTAPKGVLGHCMGAAGAIEAGLTVLTLQHGIVPPIANLDAPDPGFAIDCVTKIPGVSCPYDGPSATPSGSADRTRRSPCRLRKRGGRAGTIPRRTGPAGTGTRTGSELREGP